MRTTRTCSPRRGWPAVDPATQMAAVLTLQVLHDYSDRETAEAVRFDVRWKAAVRRWRLMMRGSTLDPGVLAEPDRPLGRPHRVNDAVKEGGGANRELAGPAPPGRRFDDSG